MCAPLSCWFGLGVGRLVGCGAAIEEGVGGRVEVQWGEDEEEEEERQSEVEGLS